MTWCLVEENKKTGHAYGIGGARTKADAQKEMARFVRAWRRNSRSQHTATRVVVGEERYPGYHLKYRSDVLYMVYIERMESL